MYDFKALSPADFEDLSRDALQAHWGVRLESFKTGRDRGIDLRYAALPEQELIVQCKHFAGSSVSKLVSELKHSELPKIVRLNLKRYVLVTSLPLNPSDKDAISAALAPYINITDDIIGRHDLNNLLGLHPEIETKHFKLWLSSTEVLQRVLHNAEKVQTDFDVDRVHRQIHLYIQNQNYQLAMKIINELKAVIISGVPGIGKTMLADMILYSHLEAGYEPVIIKSDVTEGRKLFNAERHQIFYFDDFLGETFLGHRFDFMGKKEDSAILDFLEMVARSKHGRIVLTTREHILRHAFQLSERFQRQKGSLKENRCVLDVKDYSLIDRAKILYNHIYFGDLPTAYKEELLRDRFYMEILKHRNFNPRLVEWLSRHVNIRQLPATNFRHEVQRILESPEQLWRTAFEHQISEASRSLLLALYLLGGHARLDRLNEVWTSLHAHRAAKYNWKSAAEDWRTSLQDLESGFLSIGKQEVQFINPSVRDFLDMKVIRDNEHLNDILAASCYFEQVVTIWSLAVSDKGAALRNYFEESPHSLLQVVNRNLHHPHEIRTGQSEDGYRTTYERDVRPEVRLRTTISIADRTRSDAALDTVETYAAELTEFWKEQFADFVHATAILRLLDSAKWSKLREIGIHTLLKEALLKELASSSNSSDFASIVEYASEPRARFTEADGGVVEAEFARYLDKDFSRELADHGSDDELESFSERLQLIGEWCGTDVDGYCEEIDQLIGQAEPPDDGERPPRNWGESSRSMLPQYEEAEVHRLFDGLTSRMTR